MSERAEPDAPQYRAARLHAVIAEDPRTNELGVQVTVRGKDVYLTGTVPSQDRKGEIERVVRDLEPDVNLHNDVRVAECGEPGEAERLR